MTSLRRVDDAVITVIAVIKCVRFPVGRPVRELSPHDRPHHERSRQGRLEDVVRPLRHHPNWNMYAAYVHLSALRLDKTDKYLSLG